MCGPPVCVYSTLSSLDVPDSHGRARWGKLVPVTNHAGPQPVATVSPGAPPGTGQDRRAALERALTEQEAGFDPDHPLVWVGRGLLAVLIDQGDRPAAETALQRVLDLYTTHLRPEHPELAASVEQVVDLLVSRGELELAKVALERIVAAKAEGFGPDHPERLASLRRLADVQRRQGNPLGAAGTLRELLDAVRRRHGDQHEQVAAVLLELGDATAAAGDLETALPLLREAMEMMGRVRGREHPSTASFATDVALAVQRAGDLTRARTLLETAVTLATRAYGEAHEEVARGLRALQDVATRQGDDATAHAAAQRLAGRPAAPEPGQLRLSRAWLDRLAPGWEVSIPPGDLGALVSGLTTLAEDLTRMGDAEAAARARAEAQRARAISG